MDWVIIIQLNEASCLVVHVSACCLFSLSPPFLPTGTLHLSRGRSCPTKCHVLSEVWLTEKDLDSLQEAYIGGRN